MVNIVLMILALVLIAATVFFWVRPRGGSGDSQGADPLAAVQGGQQGGRGRDARLPDRRLQGHGPPDREGAGGATGSFKEQYDGAKANLKTSATTAQAVSTGKVLSVGISDIDEKNAVVFVAATPR